jgi:hypothetical protein
MFSKLYRKIKKWYYVRKLKKQLKEPPNFIY